MPKFYIESGTWRKVIYSSDFINGVIKSIEDLVLNSKEDYKLAKTVSVNQEGFISDLLSKDGCLSKKFISKRKKNHIVLKNLNVERVKKTGKDVIIILPTKLLFKLLGFPHDFFEHITERDCDGMNVLE